MLVRVFRFEVNVPQDGLRYNERKSAWIPKGGIYKTMYEAITAAKVNGEVPYRIVPSTVDRPETPNETVQVSR